ncbi:MAG: PAS domain S-box protein, partial [Chloroflexi bacterium]
MKKPTRILIVEDMAADAGLATREIRKTVNNCEFQIVEIRKDFLTALEVFQPDVILSDYSLPHFDGRQALKLALEHAPLTPFIIWTGSISEDVAVDCMKAGANNYVLKENIQRLGPAVIHALEERESLMARRQAEENLKERERQLTILFGNLPGPVYRCSNDADYTMEFISDGITELSGYQAEDFRQHRRHFGRMIHPGDQERVWAEIQTAVERNQPFESTYRIVTATGEQKWVWEKGQGILDAEGRLQALEGFITDITKRKQAEEALQNSEKRFRALIENGLDNISLLKADGTLIWESPATVRMLNYVPGEFIKRNIFELMHPEDLELTRDAYGKLLREPGGCQSGVFRLRHSDGTWRWAEAIATNMLDEPSVNAIVVNYRDITERKQAEIKLQQRN